MQRGDVVEIRLPKGMGSEQWGRRYGVVIQSDVLLPRSVVIIAPTSTSARAASIRPEIVVEGMRTRVLVEQLGALDVRRLGKVVGSVRGHDLWAIDDALERVLGLD
jgi:mRNA interferase MazF